MPSRVRIRIRSGLTRRPSLLNLGGSVHGPADPVRRLLFNVLRVVAPEDARALLTARRSVMVRRGGGQHGGLP